MRFPRKKEIGLFVIIYALFSVAGFLFPIDKEWYASLRKPTWTPAGQVIGIIWAVLFGLISLATVLVARKTNFGKDGSKYYLLLLFNYIFNQAFSYFQFNMKNLWLATVDCVFVALTSFMLVFSSAKKSKTASMLLVPYVLWSSFATYLAYTIYSLNK